jgi:hypothetical protein
LDVWPYFYEVECDATGFSAGVGIVWFVLFDKPDTFGAVAVGVLDDAANGGLLNFHKDSLTLRWKKSSGLLHYGVRGRDRRSTPV